MTVSMLQFIIELPETTSIKDKRRIIKSIKDKTRLKFHVSCAEVDLQDSLRFSQLGAALVSNSSEFGETVMHNILKNIEVAFPIRLHDAQIHSERFD
jgi:uncharacterized protein